MSSSGGGIDLSLLVQGLAVILTVIGTEQCSDLVSSALTRGYLYAAATPMSIFGSLGVVSAGFKTLLACFSLAFGNIEGAKILWKMGFEPRGDNLSLIMVEEVSSYVIQTQMDELIKKLNIDENRITGVSLGDGSAAWNVKMIATTALLCAFSIAPYIYLIRGANLTTWVFPIMRATGSFITATLIQLLIQRRIFSLSNQYVDYLKRDHWQHPNTDHRDVDVDAELCVFTPEMKMDARTWLSLYLLLIGLVASVVGYVGCLAIVQISTTNIGPVSWLCLEVGLSLMRLAIWAWNPTRDDAPPLEIHFELDKSAHKPLPTCNKDNEEILQYKVLPLTQARDFLKIIASFAGPVRPFSNPDLSLYYTLTRKRPSENAEKHKLGEWILYITIFNHKEHTTRVYTRDNEMDTCYSTKSDAPLVDVEHFLLEVEIDAKINNPRGICDGNIWDSLKKHYRSILGNIQYRLGAGDVTAERPKPYVIENSWTMKFEDTTTMIQRLREENRDDWKTIIEKGKEERNDPEESLLIRDYFMHSSIERARRLLDEKRVKWIARRMKMITKETKESFQDKMRVDTKFREEIKQLLFSEQYMMELLLLYEVKAWEQLFWKKFKAFRKRIGNNRVEVKERLTREWRADCWKRLNPQMRAAEKRLADFDIRVINKDGLPEKLGKYWASSVSQFFDGDEKRLADFDDINKDGFPEILGRRSLSISQFFDGDEDSDSNSISLFDSELREEIQLQVVPPEIRLRIEKEIEDIESRLKRGSELERFDQFWDDDTRFLTV